MPRRRRPGSPTSPPVDTAGDPRPSKLEGMRPVRHDDDAERPTREDLSRGGSPFDIPVPLPRFLRPKRKR